MRKLLALSIVMAVAATASAAIWTDNFDSYADQAAFDAVYTQIYPATPMVLDQTVGYSGTQSINPPAPNVNYTCRAYMNLGGEFAGSDAAPLTFETMIMINDATDWWSREYLEIRGYTGAGYGDGDLEELIALGVNSSGVDTTKFNARVLSGDNWIDLSEKVAEEWVKLSAVIKTDTVELYVNDVLANSSPRAAGVTLDSIVLGSGLSSRVDVHFDDLNIVPEPAALSLLAVGGLALLRRRR